MCVLKLTFQNFNQYSKSMRAFCTLYMQMNIKSKVAANRISDIHIFTCEIDFHVDNIVQYYHVKRKKFKLDFFN